jgi:hypothetical protein
MRHTVSASTFRMIDEVYEIGSCAELFSEPRAWSKISSVRRHFREFMGAEVDLGTICAALCRAACDRISAVENNTQSQLYAGPGGMCYCKLWRSGTWTRRLLTEPIGMLFTDWCPTESNYGARFGYCNFRFSDWRSLWYYYRTKTSLTELYGLGNTSLLHSKISNSQKKYCKILTFQGKWIDSTYSYWA